MKNKVLSVFESKFGNPQRYVKSPGRANIIGEHTDYNHGLVFPFAIEQYVGIALGENKLKKLRLVALDLGEEFELDLIDVSYSNDGWSRYFINALVAMGHNTADGIDVVFGGNLPQGGGVSSSSAITCGFIAGVNSLFDYEHSIDYMIHLASQAENGIGLNGGTMDQTAIFKGEEGKAMMIDFQDFSVTKYTLPSQGYKFYLFNSGQKHNLVDTEYNIRRATCDSAVRQVHAIDPRVETLRQMTASHIMNIVDGETAKKRCIHVIEENARVQSAATVLSGGNIEDLGPLMNQSHRSLSQNFEVSTPEIDYLVNQSIKINNILGARIMGGGFGGCTINLVKGELQDSNIEKLKENYKCKTGFDIDIIEVKPSDGVVLETL